MTTESLSGLGSGQPLDRAGASGIARRRPALRLQGPDRDRYLFEIARCLKLSHAGLRRRGRIDQLGRDESRTSNRWSASSNGPHAAEEMLDKFNGEWGGSVEPAYQEYAF